MQHASLHIREARAAQSLLPSPADDPIATSSSPFYELSSDAISSLEEEVNAENLQCKKDWFTYNGGDASGAIDRKSYKKPLFFDIALNYVELDMERLQERAGKKVAPPPQISSPTPQRAVQQQSESDKPKSVVSRAKIEEIQRPATPEPDASAAKGGLSSLLGGWWGRK